MKKSVLLTLVTLAMFASFPAACEDAKGLLAKITVALGAVGGKDVYVPIMPVTSENPISVKLGRSYRINSAESAHEIHCNPSSACLPFIVITSTVTSRTNRMARQSLAPLQRRNEVVVFEIRSSNYRGTAFAVCERGGNAGDTVPVHTLDRKQKFLGRIVRRGLVVALDEGVR